MLESTNVLVRIREDIIIYILRPKQFFLKLESDTNFPSLNNRKLSELSSFLFENTTNISWNTPLFINFFTKINYFYNGIKVSLSSNVKVRNKSF